MNKYLFVIFMANSFFIQAAEMSLQEYNQHRFDKYANYMQHILDRAYVRNKLKSLRQCLASNNLLNVDTFQAIKEIENSKQNSPKYFAAVNNLIQVIEGQNADQKVKSKIIEYVNELKGVLIPEDITKKILKHNKSYVFDKVQTLQVKCDDMALSSRGVLAYFKGDNNSNTAVIKFWDIKNNIASDFEIPLQYNFKFKWSPDGSMLAVITCNNIRDYPKIAVWDYQNKTKVSEISIGSMEDNIVLFSNKIIRNFVWSPDNSKIAVIKCEAYYGEAEYGSHELTIHNVKDGKILSYSDLEYFKDMRILSSSNAIIMYWFKNDSLALFSYFVKRGDDVTVHGCKYVMNFYNINFNQIYGIKLKRSIYDIVPPRLTFSYDGHLLAVLNIKSNTLYWINTDNFETILTQPLSGLGEISRFEGLSLSQDNNILAIEDTRRDATIHFLLLDLENLNVVKDIGIDRSSLSSKQNQFIWSTEPNNTYFVIDNGTAIDVWQGTKFQ